MKIGYACLNYSIGLQANKTFRLASYTPERFYETTTNNISALETIIKYNQEQSLGFFRISSEIVPFASHPIMKEDWLKFYAKDLSRIGSLINKSQMRISMHPDQFVLINSPKADVVGKSIADLMWQCQLLSAMGLNNSAKVQIHVGGVYGDKESAINAFITNYKKLPTFIKDRLVIENDDKCFSLKDCMKVHDATKIPIIFDNFHHECLNDGLSMIEAVKLAKSTWSSKDGVLMGDYSSQQPGAIKGKHIDSIDQKHFEAYIKLIKSVDIDLMLEIKDKEKSALFAKNILKNLNVLTK